MSIAYYYLYHILHTNIYIYVNKTQLLQFNQINKMQ